MLTQSEADNLSRRVMFLEKDRARMCERIKKLEERLDALAPAAPKDVQAARVGNLMSDTRLIIISRL